MCGFAGIIAWDERFRASHDLLARMSACVAHRGPDGEGFYIHDEGELGPLNAAVALAHRRLAVIDPDPRANQPFADSRGRQLVFNGEIYNFRELRAEITTINPQYPWRTNCDTEVLLAAHDAWGGKCCEKFDGMFAFAIWDPADQSLLLARDRTGQKPLYLAVQQTAGGVGAVAFASELSALRTIPWVDATTDLDAIGHYLRWGYIPSPMTACKGCEKLPPGRWMRLRARGLEVREYGNANDAPGLKPEPTAGHVREMVVSAVRRQLVSDVPLGCFLSGGIDSSIIAAAMKACVEPGQEIHTFSIGFDDPRYDESAYAQEVARHLGTKHRAFVVRPDVAEDLPKLAATFGEPFADSSALPTHWLAHQTRAHVTVALSGDGGDELFGGYDRYRAMMMADGFQSLPAGLRKIAVNKIWEHILVGKHPKSRSARLKRLLASLDLPADKRYDGYMRIFDEPAASALLCEPEAQKSQSWLADQFAALLDRRDGASCAMALDRLTYLPEDLHTKVDRAAMLCALEVRAPFMDVALLQFAAGLTTKDLFGSAGGTRAFMQSPMNSPGKRLLREAFARDLPASVFKRPKMGFAVPVGEWFRGELRGLLHDALKAKDSFAADYLHRPTINRLLEDHDTARADHGQRLYALLMLELWRKL